MHATLTFCFRPDEKPEDSWDAFNIVSTEENNLKREARIAFFHKVRSIINTWALQNFLNKDFSLTHQSSNFPSYPVDQFLFLLIFSLILFLISFQVFKFAAIVFTFIIILGGTIITKMTVLIAASNIKLNMTLNCIQYNRFDSTGNVSMVYARLVSYLHHLMPNIIFDLFLAEMTVWQILDCKVHRWTCFDAFHAYCPKTGKRI